MKNIRQHIFKMKMVACIAMAMLSFTCCEKDPESGIYLVSMQEWTIPDLLIHDAVTDIDGNVYDAVQIGRQTWMAQNLRVLRYADGTSVLNVPNATYYLPSYEAQYGYLYNWSAVTRNGNASSNNPSGVQGLCPNGWHMPSADEWRQLIDFVSGQEQYVAYGESYNIAKSLADTAKWASTGKYGCPGCEAHCNNLTGFSAFPAGKQSDATVGKLAYFWSTTPGSGNTSAFALYLSYDNPRVNEDYFSKDNMMAVRCVKD